jgi:hypothetical protein
MTDPLPRRIARLAPWTWKRRTWAIVALLVLFVGYPLSFGPAVALYANGYLPGYIVLTAYYPFYWVRESPAFDGWLRWYIRLFGV